MSTTNEIKLLQEILVLLGGDPLMDNLNTISLLKNIRDLIALGTNTDQSAIAQLQAQLASLTSSDIDFNDLVAQLEASTSQEAIEKLDQRLDAIQSNNPAILNLYVAPGGSYTNSGLSATAPFPHLAVACNELKKYHLDGTIVTIFIAPGDYPAYEGAILDRDGNTYYYSELGAKLTELKGSPASISILGTGTFASEVIINAENLAPCLLVENLPTTKLILSKLTLKASSFLGNLGGFNNSFLTLNRVIIDSNRGKLSLSNSRLEITRDVANQDPFAIKFQGTNTGIRLNNCTARVQNFIHFNNASGASFLELIDSKMDWTVNNPYVGSFTGRSFTSTRSTFNYNSAIPASIAPTIDNFSLINGSDYKNTTSGLLATNYQTAIDELKQLTSSIEVVTVTSDRQLQNSSARVQDLTNPASTIRNVLLPTPQLAKEFLIINEETSIGNFLVNGSIVVPGDRYGIVWNGSKWLEL